MKKFLFGLIAGVSAGMFFAPKPGKKLREQLKKSETPFSDFGKVFVVLAKDAGGELKTFLDSDDVQKVISSGKKSAEEFISVLETKGSELSTKAQKELESLLDIAVQKTEKAQQKTKNALKTARKVLPDFKEKEKKEGKEEVEVKKKKK